MDIDSGNKQTSPRVETIDRNLDKMVVKVQSSIIKRFFYNYYATLVWQLLASELKELRLCLRYLSLSLGSWMDEYTDPSKLSGSPRS